MKAIVKQVEGLSLVAKSDSNHWLPVDGKKIVGGSEAATLPMELVLISLGSCTSMDVLSILKKMREQVTGYKMEINSERASEHPAVFTKIHLKYIIYGSEIKPENVTKAIELSMNKYCSVSAMLKESVDISWDFEIREI